MMPLKNNVIYEDLGIINQLISQHKFFNMDDEAVEIWWSAIIDQLMQRVKRQFYYYDKNRKNNHSDKFNFHTRVLTNLTIEGYISTKENPTEYVVELVRRIITSKFNTDEVLTIEMLLSDIHFYSLFLQLKNESAIITVPINYDYAGIRLSGSESFSYPKGSDKRAKPEDQQGGAYYKPDLYPNMPKSGSESARYIEYSNGEFYRLL